MLRNAERAILKANLNPLLRDGIRQADVDVAGIVIRVVPLRCLLFVGPPRNFVLEGKELFHRHQLSRAAAEKYRTLLSEAVLPVIECSPVSHRERVERLLFEQRMCARLSVRQTVQDKDIHPEMV